MTGARDRVVVEAAFGQGEVLVSGAVEPDTYVFTAPRLDVVSVRVGHQTHEIVRGRDGHDLTVALDLERAAGRVLDDEQAVAVARMALRVQHHFGRPQDVEWALVGRQLFLVQARPLTALDDVPSSEAPLVRGLGAAPGRACGPARILTAPADAAALGDGEVLVAAMTDPDWLPAIRRASAPVTDRGGTTCHAAIVARELGVPCVVGTGSATEILRDGQVVTVDGAAGEVYAGRRPATAEAQATRHSLGPQQAESPPARPAHA